MPAISGDVVLILVGALLATVIVMVGSYTGIKRLFGYAVALLALFVHGALQNYAVVNGMDIVREAIGLHILTFGALVFLVGCVLLVRFLINNPIEQDSNDEI